MTTTTAGNYNLGITYGQNHWLAWTQRGVDQTTFQVHIGQTRELAIKRAQERTSVAVGEALRGLHVDDWVAQAPNESRLPVKAIPKMCHRKGMNGWISQGTLESTQLGALAPPIRTPRGPAARSTEVDIGSTWACYTVVRFVREAKSQDGRDNPVLAVKPSCCGREVEMHRKSLFSCRNAHAKMCATCSRAHRTEVQREKRLKAAEKLGS